MVGDHGISQCLPVLPDVAMFFKPEHQIIYDALLVLYIAKVPIDAIMLRTELKKSNKLEEIGGVEYIAKILGSIPSSANAVYISPAIEASLIS